MKKRAKKLIVILSFILISESIININTKIVFAYTENASISLCNGDNISTNNQVLMTYYDSSYEAPSIQNQMDLISVYDNNENLFKSSYIPKVYDSRDKGYVTAVKNQGGLGICWSYAAVAAMESYALSHGLVNDEIDLDEYALAYMSYDDNGYSDELGNSTGDVTNIMSDSSMYQCLMSGGNDYIAFKTLSKWAGIINQQSNHEGIYLETDYKFQSNDLSYILTGQKYINMSDTDLIKQAVMENGALTVYYNGSSTYFSDIDRYGKYSYNYENTFCNHAVALIGWDDSFDKNMFTVTDSDGNIHTPDSDGAWLVKNSWGTNKMFEGYTWISYDDKAINSCNAAIYEVANKQKYEHNYQYDGSTVFGSSASSFLMGRSYANVFCVNESNAQNLKAVSFATRDALRNYEIKIYKNPEKQKQSNTSDTTLRYNPESGTLMCTVNGTTTYAGYYTVTLPQDIILSAGDVFSIVVSFDQDTIMEHSLESCYVGAGANAVNVIDDNQSFFSKDGVDVSNKSYIDTAISGFRGMAYNYCIKAFTDDANVNDMVINEASILSVKQNNIDSIEIDWKSVNNATNYRLYRSDNMSSGYEIIYDGEQTLYYDSNIEIGKTYYYKTVAYNNNLNIRSEESDVSIIYVTLPAVNIKSCIGNQENITLSWSSLDGVDSYAIYRSDDNKHYDKIAEVSSNTTVYKDLNNNLKFNQNYYYIVKYYKYINGEKKESNSSVSEYAQKKLDRVNNINSDGTRYNSILLSWEENIKATGYKIMRTNNTNGAYIEIADVRGTYYRDDVSGLQKGTNISYIVQPYVLEDSEKKYGNTVSVHAFLRYEPLSNVCLNIVDGKLVATWDSFSGDSKYLSGYNIYISNSKDGPYIKDNIYPFNGNTYIFNNIEVSDDLVYYVKIVAYGRTSMFYYPEDITSLQDEPAIYGNESLIEKKYKVIFKNRGEVVKTEEVKEGASATAPSEVEKENNFKCWDKDFSNVSSDMEINAVYKVTEYEGVDYSAVFDAEYYLDKYSDLRNVFGDNENEAIKHFVECGMKEGRQAKEEFEVYSYKARYVDLRDAFGEDLKQYYKHYIIAGKTEGRDGTKADIFNVIFKDGETIVKTDYVISGGSTTAPESIELKKGFKKWDKDFSSITSNIEINAVYKATKYDGVDYSAVFDSDYYLNKYADLKVAFGDDDMQAIKHFVECGMKEGRQGNKEFDVKAYQARYKDLRDIFGEDNVRYYMHYVETGKAEGRDGTALRSTEYEGTDYAAVFNAQYYLNKYADLKVVFGDNEQMALMHFIECGMKEGRQAIESFDVSAYKARYTELRVTFGDNLENYYMHYIETGKAEGRDGTALRSTEYEGTDYATVFNAQYYLNKYADLKAVFGDNEQMALMHFIECGMKEGRQAIESFDVSAYKARYADLRASFGENLESYYMHYIKTGKLEGRYGTIE